MARSGFEITGYMMTRTFSKWARPSVAAQRNGFEITGYAALGR